MDADRYVLAPITRETATRLGLDPDALPSIDTRDPAREHSTPEGAGQFRITLWWHRDAGAPVVDAVLIAGRGGDPLESLAPEARRAAVAWLARWETSEAYLAEGGDPHDAPTWQAYARGGSRGVQKSLARRSVTPDRLHRVAQAYRLALDAGMRSPRLHVAEAERVSPSNASKLIRAARNAGLLGPTTPGRKGETADKARGSTPRRKQEKA